MARGSLFRDLLSAARTIALEAYAVSLRAILPCFLLYGAVKIGINVQLEGLVIGILRAQHVHSCAKSERQALRGAL